MPRKKLATASIDLETAMAQLNEIVSRLEKGEMSLEESLNQYEHAIHLIQQCQHTLKSAMQRVEMLSINEDGEETLEIMDENDDE